MKSRTVLELHAAKMMDCYTIERAREHTAGWVHAIGNGAALALALISLLLRLDGPVAAVLPWGFALSVVGQLPQCVANSAQ